MSQTVDASLGMSCFLTLAVALMITACSGAGAKDDSANNAAQKATEVERFVDALANRNPRPTIVKRIGHSDPMFDEGYDWTEQDRVLEAIRAVAKQGTPETWEVLVAHQDDNRYCLTFANENGFTHNKSVGDFCRWIAYDDLMFPVRRIEERLNQERASGVKRIFLDGIGEPLDKWRAARPRKAFFELQIEVCQRALEDLRHVKGVPDAAKTDCRKRLKADIDTLRSNKSGIFGGFKFPGDRHEIFDKKRADEMRRS